MGKYQTGRSRSKARRCWEAFRPHLMVISIILGVALGIALGAGLRTLDPPLTAQQAKYLKFPGDLLLRMLKMLILPLVVSSLISGIASLPSSSTGKLGARAIAYYMCTTLFAVILGIVLVVTIQPGNRGEAECPEPPCVDRADKVVRDVEALDSLLDLVLNCFPSNLIEAAFRQTATDIKKTVMYNAHTVDMSRLNDSLYNLIASMDPDVYKQNANISEVMQRNVTNKDNVTETQYYVNVPYIVKSTSTGTKDGMNVLGLIVFSVALGIVISKLGARGVPLKNFFASLCDAVLVLIHAVLWYVPIGLFFLVAERVVSMDDPARVLEQLGYYMLTVIIGLVVHGYILLPIIYLIFVRRNPYKYIYGVLKAIFTALGTASSSATMPVTMQCCKENNGVHEKAVDFVIPIGATINMDGTALYEAVASIFIAQVNNIPLNFGQIVTVSITSTAASIGAAGVPEAGLITMAIVLTAVGLPLDDIQLIFAVDWFLDRLRTSVNVLGDAFGAGIVGHLSRHDLNKMDAIEEAEAAEAGNATDTGFGLPTKNGYINDSYEPDGSTVDTRM
ncbi:excitatory amino acid transporter 1 [Lingula anatina]|uniref:Amino acid transporter n=1 Tax=Lingula anatina TaxID=7574 RepID=A0A1S3K0W8_LINAN|nr:excitatory amino acid transporter 1 [Lingula anatina]XP_013416266.1 excitatory amino acid transporter 1 [Lingula anatina]XP_013416267.1 excitatory amino acid transporter 1 [Lingula anatina]XP_013416268.1 excitatory amino acid transporter 1 [Lingula anatina]XP_013416269.1 excitatory amino acid transporter 1 [Lingula anatina]XP_013416270.1 excitatory amino acid transporter 1 [Lingula anatina]XP_013416271.1 excitatory amino acid transporter 1 [Lingula anatina]|eukprot:XP_013416265.1 excitatory amino acid transporter 1 [Lingula anatina]